MKTRTKKLLPPGMVEIQWRIRPSAKTTGASPQADYHWTKYVNCSKGSAEAVLQQKNRDPLFEYRINPLNAQL